MDGESKSFIVNSWAEGRLTPCWLWILFCFSFQILPIKPSSYVTKRRYTSCSLILINKYLLPSLYLSTCLDVLWNTRVNVAEKLGWNVKYRVQVSYQNIVHTLHAHWFWTFKQFLKIQKSSFGKNQFLALSVSWNTLNKNAFCALLEGFQELHCLF